MHYLRSQAFDDVQHNRIRTFIVLELVLFAWIPFVASLMARGISLASTH